jgi:hypothetical protein
LEPICSSTGKHLVDAQDRHQRDAYISRKMKMESMEDRQPEDGKHRFLYN